MAPIQLITFNCNGFQSCANDVLDFFNGDNNCIAFLSEHWLRPHELYDVKVMLEGEGLWSYLKSSVDPEEELLGRPYGGVGFVCKQNPNSDYSMRPVPVNSDRIAVLQLVKDGKVKLSVVGIYLPHFNGSADQVTLYAETLDLLQTTIDDHAGTPLIIMGDMNASLPQTASLSRHWYRARPFNKNSLLLYDFLVTNDLCVANFSFTQPVNYTYKKSHHQSYIDHVFVPVHAIHSVTDCHIMCHDDIIASDHLPLSVTYSLPEAEPQQTCESGTVHEARFPRIHWNKQKIREEYKTKLSVALANMQKDIPGDINDSASADLYVNTTCETLTSTIHNVCQEISNHCHSGKRGGRRLPWWNQMCSSARDRTRFWHKIWNACGRDRSTTAFQCYKLAKRLYRDTRRQSLARFRSMNSEVITSLFRHGNSRQFWNRVKALRNAKGHNTNDIDIEGLQKFYKSRFGEDRNFNEGTLKWAKNVVTEKYRKGTLHLGFAVSEACIVKLVKKLKLNRSPGFDGIQPEHVKYGICSLSKILCNIITVCGKYGVLPKSFCTGLLVPILKKPALDPSVPKNYRPIIISTTFSKLLEYCILDDIYDYGAYKPHDLQFGFVEGRNTNMAISLSRDVISYFNSRGSSVYTCTLDAEMAFDGIPHFVLLAKAIDVIPDCWWKVLHSWYDKLLVMVKWDGKLSDPFKIEKGTRQGGLTSPLLFNLFYYDLAVDLSNINHGLTIDHVSYNTFIYADDILLMSSTSTGLQYLIDKANNYITSYGLRFNAEKTKCATFGKCFLNPKPAWNINGAILQQCNNFDYLGAVMSANSSFHVDKRLHSCRQSFYCLQNIVKGCDPNVLAFIWKTVLQPCLTYGNECMPMRNGDMSNMEKLQARLIKCALCLGKFCYTSPLLKALRINRISQICDNNALNLLKRVMYDDSRGKQLYNTFLCKSSCTSSLLSRCIAISKNRNVSLFRFLTSNQSAKYSVVINNNCDGLVDSLRNCFSDYNERSKTLARLLLSPF